jgi:hypothetical protein
MFIVFYVLKVVWDISRADVGNSFKIDYKTGQLFVNEGAHLVYLSQSKYSIQVVVFRH